MSKGRGCDGDDCTPDSEEQEPRTKRTKQNKKEEQKHLSKKNKFFVVYLRSYNIEGDWSGEILGAGGD